MVGSSTVQNIVSFQAGWKVACKREARTDDSGAVHGEPSETHEGLFMSRGTTCTMGMVISKANGSRTTNSHQAAIGRTLCHANVIRPLARPYKAQGNR